MSDGTMKNRDRFSKTIDLSVQMPRFTWKINVYSSISLELPEMCVQTLRTGLRFSKMINLWVHMPRFTQKMNISPCISLETPINMCWNHKSRASFPEMIDLRGHMPRFTWKMNVFPSISLEMPEMCVQTIWRGFIFPRWSIGGVTYLGLLEKWMFSHLSHWKPHKFVLKLSEKGLFFQDHPFERSHA